MTDTTDTTGATETQPSAFDIAVARHRERLVKRYEDGYLSRGFMGGTVATLRVRATAAQRFVCERSVGGTLGFLIGAMLVTVCALNASFFSETDPSAGPLAGVGLGLASWAAGAWCGYRGPRSAVQNLGHASGIFDTFNEAAREIERASERDVPGSAEAFAAADEMRPGLEELIDEYRSLRVDESLPGDFRALVVPATVSFTALSGPGPGVSMMRSTISLSRSAKASDVLVPGRPGRARAS